MWNMYLVQVDNKIKYYNIAGDEISNNDCNYKIYAIYFDAVNYRLKVSPNFVNVCICFAHEHLHLHSHLCACVVSTIILLTTSSISISILTNS